MLSPTSEAFPTSEHGKAPPGVDSQGQTHVNMWRGAEDIDDGFSHILRLETLRTAGGKGEVRTEWTQVPSHFWVLCSIHKATQPSRRGDHEAKRGDPKARVPSAFT